MPPEERFSTSSLQSGCFSAHTIRVSSASYSPVHAFLRDCSPLGYSQYRLSHTEKALGTPCAQLKEDNPLYTRCKEENRNAVLIGIPLVSPRHHGVLNTMVSAQPWTPEELFYVTYRKYGLEVLGAYCSFGRVDRNLLLISLPSIKEFQTTGVG